MILSKYLVRQIASISKKMIFLAYILLVIEYQPMPWCLLCTASFCHPQPSTFWLRAETQEEFDQLLPTNSARVQHPELVADHQGHERAGGRHFGPSRFLQSLLCGFQDRNWWSDQHVWENPKRLWQLNRSPTIQFPFKEEYPKRRTRTASASALPSDAHGRGREPCVLLPYRSSPDPAINTPCSSLLFLFFASLFSIPVPFSITRHHTRTVALAWNLSTHAVVSCCTTKPPLMIGFSILSILMNSAQSSKVFTSQHFLCQRKAASSIGNAHTAACHKTPSRTCRDVTSRNLLQRTCGYLFRHEFCEPARKRPLR